MSNVQSTFRDPHSVPSDFLKQAHPSPGTLPIVPQVQNFYKQTQPTDKKTFFNQVGRSGTSGIGTRGKITDKGESNDT